MSLYLWLHLFTVAFPLARSFEPKVAYASRWRALFPAIALTAAFFIVWDILFTRAGVWGFNDAYLSGIRAAGLPLEEWLFFVSVPFASVFIYDCVAYFDKNDRLHRSFQAVSVTAGVALFSLSLVFVSLDYTFYNFLFAGALLVLQGVVFRNRYMGRFYVAYLLHLVPFILVNGVLTGGLTQEPVVWYNNEENLGIRLWTIPIEDFIYAHLLFLMNVSWYEFFTRRLISKHNT